MLHNLPAEKAMSCDVKNRRHCSFLSFLILQNKVRVHVVLTMKNTLSHQLGGSSIQEKTVPEDFKYNVTDS